MKKFLFIMIMALVPSLLMAQAAGGQIKRNRSNSVKPQKSVENPAKVRKTTKHDYVDLGLSVKWATSNLGATSPSDFGNYYAWAEIEPKADYSENTYVYHNDKGQYYVFDSDIEGTEDDAAHVAWKGSWRLPTKEEWEELARKCNWKWTNKEGHNGYLITGSNGNSIFLPAAGGYIGSKLSYTEMGLYWSSKQMEEFVSGAYGFHFNSSGKGWGDGSFRWQGHTIRPVLGK